MTEKVKNLGEVVRTHDIWVTMTYRKVVKVACMLGMEEEIGSGGICVGAMRNCIGTM